MESILAGMQRLGARNAGAPSKTIQIGLTTQEILRTLRWPMLMPISGGRLPLGGPKPHPAMDPAAAWGYIDRVQPWWLRRREGD